MHVPLTRQELGRLLHEKLPIGDPDLVVVDRRSLELIMGDLAPLLILADLDDDFLGRKLKGVAPIEEPYVWDTFDERAVCQECGALPGEVHSTFCTED